MPFIQMLILALTATITAIVFVQRAPTHYVRLDTLTLPRSQVSGWLRPCPDWPAIAIASVDVAHLVVGQSTALETGSADSLFLGNDLRYTERLDDRRLSEMLVVAFDQVHTGIPAHHRLVEQQKLRLAAGAS